MRPRLRSASPPRRSSAALSSDVATRWCSRPSRGSAASTLPRGCRAAISSSRSSRACAGCAPIYLDLYDAHFPDPDTPLEQTLAVYDDLIRQGKLRYVALSNHPAWQLTEALWIADDRRMASAPVCAQVMYSLLDRSAEAELSAACVRFGLSIVPYAPLHGGLLARSSGPGP